MGEFESGDEAGLLVKAAEVTDKVDNRVLFLEGLIGQGVIKVVKGLFDLVGIVGAHMLVIGIVQQLQDGVCIGAKLLHIHSSILRVVCRQVETAVGVEFLEFDLGFEAVLGFVVTAVDGSEELCKRVNENYGIEALCMRFEDIAFHAEFDAIWACASLLHVKKADIPNIMKKVSASLKPGGVLYASFKYGSDERISGGRFFNNYTERDLGSLLTEETQLTLLEYRITRDVRPERAGERWLNFTAKKK